MPLITSIVGPCVGSVSGTVAGCGWVWDHPLLRSFTTVYYESSIPCTGMKGFEMSYTFLNPSVVASCLESHRDSINLIYYY